MGKMLNQQGQTHRGDKMHSQQHHQQPLTSHSTLTTIYLSHQPPSNLLSQYLEKFNCYKRFVQNTIIQLGEDWRIESGLLAQEIINETNLNNDEFCIFNEFMAGFVRSKFVQLQREGERLVNVNVNVSVNVTNQEQQQQYEFLRYFCHSFEYNGIQIDVSQQLKLNTNSNNVTANGMNVSSNHSGKLITTSKQTDFSSNLTFKTLSLGFYITAGDAWMRMFKKYHKEQVEEGDTSFKHDMKYFASLITRRPTTIHQQQQQQQWAIHPQQQISALLLLPYHHQQLLTNNNNISDSISSTQHLCKSIRLGSVVVNITETTTIQNNQVNSDGSTSNTVTVRRIALCRQFYLQVFLVWLVFSIKKSFNTALFPSSCFIRYCDIIIGSRIFIQKQKDLVNYHPIYHQFKLLCDAEWKRLMKDYMVALNDDKQVLKVLVKRIEGLIIQRFNKELQGKREEIKKMSYHYNTQMN